MQSLAQAEAAWFVLSTTGISSKASIGLFLLDLVSWDGKNRILSVQLGTGSPVTQAGLQLTV